ncbi:MAG TPA: hypothetical protein VMJ32_12810 [Pirellulales bacterium]|nr:hypothetical protein [Pirellulales bacterium]
MAKTISFKSPEMQGDYGRTEQPVNTVLVSSIVGITETTDFACWILLLGGHKLQITRSDVATVKAAIG